MNKVVLMGRLTRDPELRQTPQGTNVCQFSLAVNRRFSKDNEADFIECQAWSKTAEFICKYFTKGSQLALCGRLEQSTWEKDGKKHSTYRVIAEEVYFTGSKNMKETSELGNMGFQTVDGSEEDLPF